MKISPTSTSQLYTPSDSSLETGSFRLKMQDVTNQGTLSLKNSLNVNKHGNITYVSGSKNNSNNSMNYVSPVN